MCNELPSLDVLRERFEMQGNTLYWRSNDAVDKRVRGKVAGASWRKGRTSYRRVMVGNVLYQAHRIAYALQKGELPDTSLFIDHIDGDGLNNTLENLRLVNHQTNNRNQRMLKTNTSGACGVCWHKGSSKWKAQAKVGGKNKHLGLFAWKDAAIAVRELASFIHGYSDRHGKAA